MRRLALIALIMGCAAGGDPGDGGSALPDRGFAVYDRVVDAEGDPVPVLDAPAGRALGNPVAVVDGERVVLYVDDCPATEDDPVPCAIARAESIDGQPFGPLETAATHRDGLRAPFVSRRADRWLLWAVDGEGRAVLRAESADGRVFSEPAPVASEPDARLDSPSVVETPDGEVLFVARVVGDGPSRLARATATAGRFGALTALTVPGTPEGWAPGEVLDPEVRLATTDVGRAVYRLAYAGRPGGGDSDVGFAASFDGIDWSSYPFNPALAGDDDERAPTNIRVDGGYRLYAVRQGRVPRVVAAERQVENPSEDF